MTLLYCHRILAGPGDSSGVSPDVNNALSEESFTGLLQSLKGRLVHWERCTPDKSREQGPGAVGLTFDDGYKDFKEVALPHIENAGVRVLLFVTTQFADQQVKPYEYIIGELLRLRPNIRVSSDVLQQCSAQPALRDRYRCLLSVMKFRKPSDREQLLRDLLDENGLTEADMELPALLNWDALRELARHPLVDIGAHTRSHPFLPSLNMSAAWQEIRGARRELETRLACSVRYFAYPYGANNWWTRGMVRAAGYHYGFSTGNSAKGPMAIPRVNVIDWDPIGASQ